MFKAIAAFFSAIYRLFSSFENLAAAAELSSAKLLAEVTEDLDPEEVINEANRILEQLDSKQDKKKKK